MTEPLIYIDRSDVREGALEELERAIADLARFIEVNEPQLLAYNAYISEDGRQMTVMHVHPDPASLDFHMEVAGPRFERFKDLVTLSDIHIYGEPSEIALNQLQSKAELLGSGAVLVERLHAGFSRLQRG